jgi:hypothetical protein
MIQKNSTMNILSMITASVMSILLLIIVSNNLPQFKTKFLSNWYNRFGTSGLIVDSVLLMLNLLVTLYLYFSIYKQFDVMQFILLSLGVQLVQSLLLIAIINMVPKGQNSMVDWFKNNRSNMNTISILEDMGTMVVAVLLYSRLHGNKMDTNVMILLLGLLLSQFMIH